MPRFYFVSADYERSISVHARATVEMESEGERKVAIGEHRDTFSASLSEAIRDAVCQLTGLRPNLSGIIYTVGGGREKCLAEVHLAVKENRQRIVGKAEHADSLQAAVAAYVDALNQL